MDERQESHRSEQVVSVVSIRAKTLIQTVGHWASRQLKCVCKSLTRLGSLRQCCVCVCMLLMKVAQLAKRLEAKCLMQAQNKGER